MSESKAKVIERNRAPRVQIAYDVEHYGSPTTIELPFVMGVMADLAGASETAEASKPVPDRAFVDVDAGRNDWGERDDVLADGHGGDVELPRPGLQRVDDVGLLEPDVGPG